MILRSELLDTEEQAWETLHAILNRIPEERWTEQIAGNWTLKDVVAHIACWHAEAARQLENIRMGHPIDWPEVEAFNAATYEEVKDLTVREVKAMSGAARHRLREELAAVAPVALSSRLVEDLRDSMDRHYAEHIAEIEQLAALVAK